MTLVLAITTRGANLCVLKIATRHAGLHSQCPVFIEVCQGSNDGVKTLPISSCLPVAAIDDEL